jgi:hypothetical protein
MMKARTVLALGSVAAAMLAAAPTASAATDPGTFATARDGNLIVVSSVLVTARRVEMMGGWNNESQSCNVERRLDVEILIDRVRAGNTTRFVDEISAPGAELRGRRPQPGPPAAGLGRRHGLRDERQVAARPLLLRHRHPPSPPRPEGDRQPLLHQEGSLLAELLSQRMRLAGIEPATSRSGGARSIP